MRMGLLILEREEGGESGRERGREGNIDMREKIRSVASRTYPDQGSNPHPPGAEDGVPASCASRPGQGRRFIFNSVLDREDNFEKYIFKNNYPDG